MKTLLNQIWNSLSSHEPDKIAFLLLSGFVCSIIGYSFHPMLWDYAFYHFVALSFTFVFWSVWLFTRLNSRIFHKFQVVAFIMFLTAISNLVDEVFFDNSKIESNEYLAWSFNIVVVVLNRKLILRN